MFAYNIALLKFCKRKIVPLLRGFATAPAATSQPVFVVSGGSKGIGLEFIKQLLNKTPAHVIALSRTAPQFIESVGDMRRFEWIHLDLEDQDSIDEVVKSIQENYGRVDMLLNIAGILGNGTHSEGPERSVGSIQRDWLKKSFEINLFGHVMLTQGLMPLLKISSDSRSPLDSNPHFPVVVNMSARVGSIGDNRLGGWYSYRMSKAALNMFTKTLSIELQRSKCIVTSFHPGTTDTDLSKPFQKNINRSKLFSPSHSVDLMLNKIFSLQLSDSGKFFAYDGQEIPW